MWRWVWKLAGSIRNCAGRSDQSPYPAILGLDPAALVKPGAAIPEVEIERRLLSMPIMVREVYVLLVVDRMTIEQIATRLAISEKKAAACLHRAVIIITRNS